MQHKHRCGIYIVLLLCIMLVGSLFPAKRIEAQAGTPNLDVRIHFIDVGQGDCTFIELPDGKTMLIDAGVEKKGKTVVKYIKKLGYKTVDYLVATHSDADHVGGLITVLEKLDVLTIYRPFTISTNTSLKNFTDELFLQFEGTVDAYASDADEIYAKFLKATYNEKVNGIPSTIKVCSDKESILSGDGAHPYMIRFFLPFGMSEFSSERIVKGYTIARALESNDTSAMIELVLDKSKYLFAGDVTTDKEIELMQNMSEFDAELLSSVTLLKVGHHGSETSSSTEFLSLTHPDHAVIMVGEGNSYALPDDLVLSYLEDVSAKIYCTSELGTIIVEEIEGVVYFNNIETLSFFERHQWLFYTILSLVLVGILVTIYIYPKLKKKGKGKVNFGGGKLKDKHLFEETEEDKKFS